MFNVIYGNRNSERDQFKLFAHVAEVAGGFAKVVRKGSNPSEVTSFLGKLFAWYCALVMKVNHRDLESVVWAKYPAACPYCGKSNCICRQDEPHEALDSVTLRWLQQQNRSRRPVRLLDWQNMFLDIYGTPNRILGEAGSFAASSWSQLLVGMNRLYEEMGELAEAIRLEHITPIAVSNELADVFAWMMAVANVLPEHLEDNEFNLELALWDQYPGNCNYCFADQCVCLNARVRQSLIASIGPDTPHPIDHLTTLPRRDTFEKELTETVSAATDRFPVSLIILDLDNFKVVNDRWGHSAGDTVLKGVALLLKEIAELFHGRAYRWGGEEFTILLTGEAADKVVECATEILSRVRSKVFEFDDGSKHRQTLSAGIATLRHSPTKPLSVVTRDFFQATDKAVYHAKSSGRDQVSTAKEDWL